MVTWCSRGRRRRGAHGRYGEGSRSLAIKIGNQTSGTGRTVPHRVDSDASSGRLGRTGKTPWTNQMALRSRWRRFESCRGRQCDVARHRRLLSSPAPRSAIDAILFRRFLILSRHAGMEFSLESWKSAPVYRARPRSTPARHRRQPGHHRAPRLRHRERSGRSRLHHEVKRRTSQPLPDPK
jgi:hypothetical protein